MDPREYYIEECYALQGCLHCPDCLAFALRYYQGVKEKQTSNGKKRREVVVKFLMSSIAAETLPCQKALRLADLKQYVNDLLDGKAKLPICHYDLAPD
jgi:hypothetical protein